MGKVLKEIVQIRDLSSLIWEKKIASVSLPVKTISAKK